MSQLIPIAFFSRDMFGNATYTSSSSADTGGTSAVVFKIGFNCTKIRVLFANYQGTIYGETNAGLSTIFIEASFQAIADTGSPVLLTFGGATGISIPPGQQVYSDWMTVPGGLTAGQYSAVRTFILVPNGGVFPTGPATPPSYYSSINGYSGSAGCNYPQYNNIVSGNANGSNQLITPGVASGWTSNDGTYFGNGAFCYGPMTIEGFVTDNVRRPIVGLVGDSIMQGGNDDIYGTGGAAVRAMVQMNVPYFMLAKGGERCYDVQNSVLFAQRYPRLSRCSTVICEYGSNDLSYGLTFSQTRTNMLQFWQFLAMNGASIIPVTLLPRPTSGSSPASSQTLNTYYSAYVSYNAWLRAPASAGAGNSAIYDATALGINMPMIIDSASYIETDSTNKTPGGPSAPNTGGHYWCGPNNNTAYSTDGTHPSPNAVVLIVPAFTAAQNTIFSNGNTTTAAQQLAMHEETLLGAAEGLFLPNSVTAAAVAAERAAVLARML